MEGIYRRLIRVELDSGTCRVVFAESDRGLIPVRMSRISVRVSWLFGYSVRRAYLAATA